MIAPLICGLCLSVAGAADSGGNVDLEGGTLRIRDQELQIWPAEDLRRHGYEIPKLSKEENAAWVYIEAVNTFVSLPEDLQDTFDYAVSSQWPKDSKHVKALADWLAEKANQKSLDLVRKAGEMEACQLPYFGSPEGSLIAVILPSLSHYRFLAKMLVAEGRQFEADGQFRKAFDNYRTVMRMGHHMVSGITLIENLVGVACGALGDQAVINLILRHDLKESELAAIQEALSKVDELQVSVARGMQGESTFGVAAVEEAVSAPTNLPHLLATSFMSDGAIYSYQHKGWRQFESRIGHLILPDRLMKEHMSGYYAKLRERSSKPAYEARWREADEEEMIAQIPQWNVLARMLLPSLTRANELSERRRASSIAARLIVALRLHATRHDGAFPLALDELDDVLPPDERVDPFSGNDFRYRKTDEGFVFYSLGENLEDDGGLPGEKGRPLDYVYRFPPEPVEPFSAPAE